MRNLWGILREVVWVAVFALVLVVLCLLAVLLTPYATGTILGLGLSAVTLALLAQRS
jgi:hypothetical protein